MRKVFIGVEAFSLHETDAEDDGAVSRARELFSARLACPDAPSCDFKPLVGPGTDDSNSPIVLVASCNTAYENENVKDNDRGEGARIEWGSRVPRAPHSDTLPPAALRDYSSWLTCGEMLRAVSSRDLLAYEALRAVLDSKGAEVSAIAGRMEAVARERDVLREKCADCACGGTSPSVGESGAGKCGSCDALERKVEALRKALAEEKAKKKMAAASTSSSTTKPQESQPQSPSKPPPPTSTSASSNLSSPSPSKGTVSSKRYEALRREVQEQRERADALERALKAKESERARQRKADRRIAKAAERETAERERVLVERIVTLEAQLAGRKPIIGGAPGFSARPPSSNYKNNSGRRQQHHQHQQSHHPHRRHHHHHHNHHNNQHKRRKAAGHGDGDGNGNGFGFGARPGSAASGDGSSASSSLHIPDDLDVSSSDDENGGGKREMRTPPQNRKSTTGPDGEEIDVSPWLGYVDAPPGAVSRLREALAARESANRHDDDRSSQRRRPQSLTRSLSMEDMQPTKGADTTTTTTTTTGADKNNTTILPSVRRKTPSRGRSRGAKRDICTNHATVATNATTRPRDTSRDYGNLVDATVPPHEPVHTTSGVVPGAIFPHGGKKNGPRPPQGPRRPPSGASTIPFARPGSAPGPRGLRSSTKSSAMGTSPRTPKKSPYETPVIPRKGRKRRPGTAIGTRDQPQATWN